MTQFSNICYSSPVNNQILFLYGHNSQFYSRALTQMQRKHIQPFIPKYCDFINYQPNDNGPNSKLKAIYNILKTEWMLKYGTRRFQPHHMNSALADTWEFFKVSYGNIIRDSFT